MKLKKLAAVSALAVASLGVSAGTAYAQPAEQAAPESIHYESEVQDQSVVTTIDAGAFRVSGDGQNVELQDSNGNVVVSLPLAYNLGDIQLPFAQTISEDGKTLTLTPSVDEAQVSPVAPEDKIQPGITPVSLALRDAASPAEDLKAQQNFSSQLGMATAIGSLSGGIIGCVIGFVAGTPVPVFGNLAGCATGFGVGSVVGTIIAGGPTLIIAGVDLLNTLAAPPGTTRFAN